MSSEGVGNGKYYSVVYSNSLSHHGILGQKWGKRNGPPYPLEAEDHSPREKKVGWRRSLRNSEKTKSTSSIDRTKGHLKNAPKQTVAQRMYDDEKSEHKKEYGFKLTEKQKKYIKIGAAVAVTALVAYGAYKMYKGNTSLGIEVTKKNLADFKNDSILHMADEDHIKMINPYFGENTGSTINCARCSAAFDLRKRGYDISAGFVKQGATAEQISSWYVDRATGKPREFTTVLKNVTKEDVLNGLGFDLDGWSKEDINRAYKGYASTSKSNLIKTHNTFEESLLRQLKSYPEGARGHLMGIYENIGGGHDICWEIRNGQVQLMDGQIGHVYKPGDIWSATKQFNPETIKFLRTDDLAVNEHVMLDKMSMSEGISKGFKTYETNEDNGIGYMLNSFFKNDYRGGSTDAKNLTFDQAYRQGRAAMRKMGYYRD